MMAGWNQLQAEEMYYDLCDDSKWEWQSDHPDEADEDVEAQVAQWKAM